MPRRRIGQEAFEFGAKEWTSVLDRLHDLIDWSLPEAALRDVYAAARGEAAWPPLSLFKALLIAVWHDLSDAKLAEALEDRGSFRRFCGFCRYEPTPERTAFVRFRRELVARELDRALFEASRPSAERPRQNHPVTQSQQPWRTSSGSHHRFRLSPLWESLA